MPADYPDFPSHRQLLAYFQGYAAHFGLAPYIGLKTRVTRADHLSDGRWSVSLDGPDGPRSETFDYVLVCSGHHRQPFTPPYPGRFSGEVLHSASYRRSEIFRGRRVLVVGGGNSGCDIAADVARDAAYTCLSMRRGYYLVPKVLFGRPVDVLYARLRAKHLPKPILQWLLGWLLRLGIGPYEKYGLQPPQSRPLEMHPTLNSNILVALRDGTVLPRVDIERFENKTVRFADGKAEVFDAVIYATGFHIAFPFLDHSVVDWDLTRPPPLYLKMMHARLANLFFIGLFQPIGCIWQLADYQARIAALQIAGRLARPADIARRIEGESRGPHWRFDSTPRHAVEVDYHDFRLELLDELKRAA
jgi:cation diffusion facilitator CzcD-associated flavoprotein CzcO